MFFTKQRSSRTKLQGWAIATLFLVCAGSVVAQTVDAEERLTPWLGRPGEGFARGATHFSINAGIGLGMSGFLTSVEAHDWLLGTAEYGWMLGGLKGEDRWHLGNWELVGQLFGGVQYEPSTAYVFGVAPIIRYNFAVGHGFVPFIDAGAGVTATDIRNGSLSTTFEFNLQAGAGVHILLKDDLALTLQYRLYHLSNAGIDRPNAGVNTSTFLAGVTWFF